MVIPTFLLSYLEALARGLCERHVDTRALMGWDGNRVCSKAIGGNTDWRHLAVPLPQLTACFFIFWRVTSGGHLSWLHSRVISQGMCMHAKKKIKFFLFVLNSLVFLYVFSRGKLFVALSIIPNSQSNLTHTGGRPKAKAESDEVGFTIFLFVLSPLFFSTCFLEVSWSLRNQSSQTCRATSRIRAVGRKRKQKATR